MTDAKIAFWFQDTGTSKFGVEIFDAESVEAATHVVQPQFDHEITCLATSETHMLIGTKAPSVLIYDLAGNFEATLATIELDKVPSEFLVDPAHQMCVCFQAVEGVSATCNYTELT